jgi:hypothetical protein
MGPKGVIVKSFSEARLSFFESCVGQAAPLPVKRPFFDIGSMRRRVGVVLAVAA